MNLKKRIAITVLALVILFGVAACSDDPDDGGNSGSTTTEPVGS